MSRTIVWLVVAGAVVIAAALGVGWYTKLHERAALESATSAVPAAPPAPAASTPPAPGAAPAKPAESTPSAAVMAPSFDVARIGRDGRAVIAGRATPGAKIVLLDGGKEIARGEADSRGEWVLLVQDPPLAPGQHELRVVQHVEGRAPVTSEQSVVVVVPERGNTADDTMVMIVPPTGAPKLVQPPSAAGVPKSNDLQLSTLDYDDRGHVTISGQALPGSTVRAYIDDKPAAEAMSGGDSHWRMAPADPVEAGKHVLRLDRLGKDGKPVARLELPFERLTAPPGTAASDNNRKLSIVKGDNLWNIARAHYGEGLQYTIIFNANKDQIRDPNLIYPGQNFSLPKVN
jgi:nucleoid-associated protein YgaU